MRSTKTECCGAERGTGQQWCDGCQSSEVMDVKAVTHNGCQSSEVR